MENPFEQIESQLKDIKGALVQLQLDEAKQGRGEVPTDMALVNDSKRLYNIHRSTLYEYHKQKIINLYKLQGRTWFSKSELEEAIKKNPI